MLLPPELPFKLTEELVGTDNDLRFLENDKWLIHTEVLYWLQNQKGRWHLTMLYVSIKNPFNFLCKKIDSYHSEKKAILFAKILQRGIRKDSRGTLKTNTDAFNICYN